MFKIDARSDATRDWKGPSSGRGEFQDSFVGLEGSGSSGSYWRSTINSAARTVSPANEGIAALLISWTPIVALKRFSRAVR